MAKKDMDVFTFGLTQTDLNDLIVKYNIPRDLHLWIPPSGFVMSELPDDAIRIYHRMFDFPGIQIPFSTFFLSVILGVFQILCKQGHWFSFAKRRAPAPVCINDNISCMNGWKTGFFFIDQRAILDYMSWRHSDLVITDRSLLLALIVIRMLPFYCTPTADAAISTPTSKDLAAATPNTKVLAKAEASNNDDDASDDDDDAYVEIPLIIPIHFAATIPLGHNHGSRGKAIMDDAVDTPSGSAVRSRIFTTPLTRDATDDIVSGSYEVSPEQWEGPHEPTLNILGKEMFKDPQVCKTVVDQFLTPKEMVWIEALTDEWLSRKISVLHCLMMSHGGELFARYNESQVSGLKKQVTDLNDKVIASDVVFVKSKAKGKEKKKKIKCFSKSLDQFTVEAARLTSDLNQGRLIEATRLVATNDYPFLNKVVNHSAYALFTLLELEPDKLTRLTVVPAPLVVGVSPPSLKESTMTLASSSVKLFLKDVHPSSNAATKHPPQE
nr:hypothetical protein [Tanacetum cinerariifolium]